MKYKILGQIAHYLAGFSRLGAVRRVADQVIEVEFEGGGAQNSAFSRVGEGKKPAKIAIVFDLGRTGSSIYSASGERLGVKQYRAPFDTVLKKRLNASKIDFVRRQEGNRILEIGVTLLGSYKVLKSILYLEFTGRFTNAILTDENGVILEALRHQENRDIKVGRVLKPLNPVEIKERDSEDIADFERYFKEEFERVRGGRLDELKAAKSSGINKKIDNLNIMLNALPDAGDLSKKADNLSQNAQLIVANLYNIKDYERELKLKDSSGNEHFIAVAEPPKIAAQNAFKEAKKLRQKAANIGLQSANLNEKITFLKGLLRLVKAAKSEGELSVIMPKKRALREDLRGADLFESFYMDGCKISVGKSQKGNEALLKEAKKDDFWLHLKDQASAHVVIKSAKMAPPEGVLVFAARLCVSFSGVSEGEVDYTKRANVRSQGGSQVLYTDYKTIFIKL